MALNLFNKKTKHAPKASEAPVADVTVPSLSIKAPIGNVLKRFFVSEKSTRGLSFNQYTFEVSRTATKTAVRDAVSRAYNVKVESVNMVTLPGKHRRIGRYTGSTSPVRKAIVTLKEGQTIAAAQP